MYDSPRGRDAIPMPVLVYNPLKLPLRTSRYVSVSLNSDISYRAYCSRRSAVICVIEMAHIRSAMGSGVYNVRKSFLPMAPKLLDLKSICLWYYSNH